MPAFVHFIDKNEKKFCFRLEGSSAFMADSPVGLEVSNRPLSGEWPQILFCDEFGVWKLDDFSRKGMTLNGVACGGGLLAGGEFITVGKYSLFFEMRFDTDEEREAYEGARRRIDEHDETEAEYALGVQYLKGEGVTQDYAKALELLKVASEGWHPDAPKEIGMMYLEGLGVEKSIWDAIGYLHRAATRGNVEAMYTLGKIFEVEESPEPAFVFYKLATLVDEDHWRAKNGYLRMEGRLTAEQVFAMRDEAHELKAKIRESLDKFYVW